MRFQFIHAADLHIDSPFAALRTKNEAVAATFAAAGRKAVEGLIETTIASGAKFLIVAGDVFDDTWRDVSTGLFFARELGKLDRAGVRTFLIRGNHDAASKMSRGLSYPKSVHMFGTRRGETQALDDLRVALHGRSFSDAEVPADFVSGYAPAREGWLNIGVLHTSLEGAAGHSPYAPCSIADLARYGYDYWALGHIHQPAVISKEPWIVYPGNIQGRSLRETGARGAVKVSVSDGRIEAVEPFALDGARWAHARADLGGLDDDDAIAAAIGAALANAHAQAEGRALAVRLTLSGRTAAHARLVSRLADVGEHWRGELQSFAYRLADDVWIEQIKLETTPPRTPVSHDPEALDVAGLLEATAQDPAYLAEVAALVKSLTEKAPPGLLDDLAAVAPAQWAARARDLLLGGRA